MHLDIPSPGTWHEYFQKERRKRSTKGYRCTRKRGVNSGRARKPSSSSRPSLVRLWNPGTVSGPFSLSPWTAFGESCVSSSGESSPSALARLPPLALEPYLHRPHALAVTPTTPARGRAPLPSSSAAAKLDECAVAEPVGALARSSRSAPAHSLKKKKVMGSSVVTAYPS